ncbi:MAG: hypothetical protein K0B15_06915 [Lentimicrobium sp.]|nr:hypothetical protein [Lentimicrobium sp.]
MKEKVVSVFSSLGALISGCFGSCGVACFATGCCGGTALLGFIGLSGSTLKIFEKLTPIFLVITVLALAYGFYKAYSPKKAECCSPPKTEDKDNSSCCEKEKPVSFFQSKAFLWVVTVLCVIMWTYPLIFKQQSNTVNDSPCCPASADSLKSSCCPPLNDTAFKIKNNVPSE